MKNIFNSEPVKWIHDHLHHTISVTAFEKYVISSQIFGRLHNVLQNSTVYFTYPSCRTSRYSHSLGCMHIASEIFQHSLTNASGDTRQQFIDEIGSTLESIQESDRFLDAVGHYFPEEQDYQELKKPECASLKSAIYRRASPDFSHSPSQQYLYTCIFQALRLAALLHDLGHPPFSHITENALKRIYEDLDEKRNGSIQQADSGQFLPAQLTHREEQYLQVAGPYFDKPDSQESGGPVESSKSFHEKLGVMMASKLLGDMVRAVTADRKLRFDALTIAHLAQEILTDSFPVLQSIHNIFDSDLALTTSLEILVCQA